MLEQLIQSALQGLAGNQSGNQSGMSPLLQIAAAMLNNNGQFGGLQGLVQQFQQAGFGSHMNSWISTGQNMPISPDQLSQILGAGRMQEMAQQAGMDPQSMSGQLSQLLPQMIDRLTPQGAVPSGGLDDALGSLGRLVR
jgi:uncharacterized protein YidB (DUF937 family)